MKPSLKPCRLDCQSLHSLESSFKTTKPKPEHASTQSEPMLAPCCSQNEVQIPELADTLSSGWFQSTSPPQSPCRPTKSQFLELFRSST